MYVADGVGVAVAATVVVVVVAVDVGVDVNITDVSIVVRLGCADVGVITVGNVGGVDGGCGMLIYWCRWSCC